MERTVVYTMQPCRDALHYVVIDLRLTRQRNNVAPCREHAQTNNVVNQNGNNPIVPTATAAMPRLVRFRAKLLGCDGRIRSIFVRVHDENKSVVTRLPLTAPHIRYETDPRNGAHKIAHVELCAQQLRNPITEATMSVTQHSLITWSQ